MQKSVLTAAIAAMMLSATASAEGMGHEGHYYVVPKLVSGMGDKVTHGAETLDGASSSGFGLDFGYKISGPWSVEVTYTSAEGDVTNDLAVTEKATYTGMGVLGVYSHHLPHDFTLVGKLGWMQESEKLAGHTTDDSGLAYVLGVEYDINGKVEAVLEYEGVDIKSPKGAALMLGAKIGF